MTDLDPKALIARIDACRAAFSGSTPVPYRDRHRVTKPPMAGAPEPPLTLLAACRDAIAWLDELLLDARVDLGMANAYIQELEAQRKEAGE